MAPRGRTLPTPASGYEPHRTRPLPRCGVVALSERVGADEGRRDLGDDQRAVAVRPAVRVAPALASAIIPQFLQIEVCEVNALLLAGLDEQHVAAGAVRPADAIEGNRMAIFLW